LYGAKRKIQNRLRIVPFQLSLSITLFNWLKTKTK
jgi:hypothetical protein